MFCSSKQPLSKKNIWPASLKLMHLHLSHYSRNEMTNINMEGQRSNAGDEGETSESFGVPDCSIRSGDLDNEKT